MLDILETLTKGDMIYWDTQCKIYMILEMQGYISVTSVLANLGPFDKHHPSANDGAWTDGSSRCLSVVISV